MRISSEKWRSNVLSLSLLYYLAHFVTSLQLIVQFDGSLRSPADTGFPTSTLGKMAACACTISRRTTNAEEPCILAMGGKYLRPTSMMTSGEAEYEGLLFALKSLRTFMGSYFIDDGELLSDVSILGDCKTVIDQMNGKSNARKMEQFYSRAQAEVDALAHESFHISPLGKLRFCHIPRTNNTICDKLSAAIIMYEQIKVFDGFCSNLLSSEDPEGCSMDLVGTLDKWFMHQKSFLPISRRPLLYRYMAELAARKRDFIGLREIGKRYENDAWELEQNADKGSKTLGFDRGTLDALKYRRSKAEAISYQIFSLYALGLSTEAGRLHTRNRFLLNQCASTVLELEQKLADVGNLPSITAALSIKVEMNNTNFFHLKKQTEWPIPVQQWHDEMIMSRTWEDHGELLFVPIQLNDVKK